jgi:hypothetical protein
MQGKTKDEVLSDACEHFHCLICDKVEIIGYGDASIDLIPRRATYGDIDWTAFGVLPPEFSCFYTDRSLSR